MPEEKEDFAEKEDASEKEIWDKFPTSELYIHKGGRDLGVVLLTNEPNLTNAAGEPFVDETSFIVKGTRFNISKALSSSPEVTQLNQIIQEANKNSYSSGVQAYRLNEEEHTVILERKKGNTFLPFCFNTINASTPGKGVYAAINSTQSTPLKKIAPKKWYTVGCLFGADLRGEDNKQNSFPLIKHGIELYNGQNISKVFVQPSSNILMAENNNRAAASFSPYEKNLYLEWENHAEMIDYFSTPGEPKELTYHLPAEDYQLFLTMSLYLTGKMTLSAMSQAFSLILERKKLHMAKIRHVFEKHNIKVTFQTPFENLFENYLEEDVLNEKLAMLDQEDKKARDLLPPTAKINQRNQDTKTRLARYILKQLNINCPAENANKSAELEQEYIKLFIKNLTEKEKPYNPIHAQAWKDFLQGHDEIKTFEDFLHLGNVVSLASATLKLENGKIEHYGDNEVATYFPHSEKPILLGYIAHLNHLNKQITKYKEISKTFSNALKSLILETEKKTNPNFYNDNNEWGEKSEKIIKKPLRISEIGRFIKLLCTHEDHPEVLLKDILKLGKSEPSVEDVQKLLAAINTYEPPQKHNNEEKKKLLEHYAHISNVIFSLLKPLPENEILNKITDLIKTKIIAAQETYKQKLIECSQKARDPEYRDIISVLSMDPYCYTPNSPSPLMFYCSNIAATVNGEIEKTITEAQRKIFQNHVGSAMQNNCKVENRSLEIPAGSTTTSSNLFKGKTASPPPSKIKSAISNVSTLTTIDILNDKLTKKTG